LSFLEMRMGTGRSGLETRWAETAARCPSAGRVLRARWWRAWAVLLLSWGLTSVAHAVLEIEITGGTTQAIGIAIVPFANEVDQPDAVTRVVESDLARSGEFRPLARAQQPARPTEAAAIDPALWKASVDYVVVGESLAAANGAAEVRFHVFDVLTREVLLSRSVRVANASQLRAVGHRVADLIYEAILRRPGAFSSRIAYVTESRTAANQPRYRLEVADSDGLNAQVALDSEAPIMSPAWAPDGERLAYVLLDRKVGGVFVQNVRTGQRENVVRYPGINSSPAWSPDGKRLAVSLSYEGNPELYLVDLASRQLRRLTQNSAVDTEPEWAPDGNGLYFTSDRGGSAQVYRLDLRTAGVQRVTFQGGYNAAPTVSPDGRWLGMVRGGAAGYVIAIQDLRTGEDRVISAGGQDESPSFAPNSQMVLYVSKLGGQSALAVSNVDTRAGQRLRLRGGGVRHPAWGALRGEPR